MKRNTIDHSLHVAPGLCCGHDRLQHSTILYDAPCLVCPCSFYVEAYPPEKCWA